MSVENSGPRETGELDVRDMRKPDRHPAIFAAYGDLEVGEAFTLVNDHDPQPLRAEFEREHRGSHRWEYLSRGTPEWRIRITRLAAGRPPRVLVDSVQADGDAEVAADGSVWRLEEGERDLDSAIVALPPGGGESDHVGPDVDILVHVLAGDGTLTTEVDTIEVAAGQLVWLPRRSRRRLAAGADGLRYLTVSQRRKALTLTP